MNIIKQARYLKKGDFFTLQNEVHRTLIALEDGNHKNRSNFNNQVKTCLADNQNKIYWIGVNRPVIFLDSTHDSQLTTNGDCKEQK